MENQNEDKQTLSFPFLVIVSLMMVEIAHQESKILESTLRKQKLTSVRGLQKSENALFFTPENVRVVKKAMNLGNELFKRFNLRVYGDYKRREKYAEVRQIRELIQKITPELIATNNLLKTDVRNTYANHDCDYIEQIASNCIVTSCLRLCTVMAEHYIKHGNPSESEMRGIEKINVKEISAVYESLHNHIGTPDDVDVNDSKQLSFFKGLLSDKVNELYVKYFTYRIHENFGICNRIVPNLQSGHVAFYR